jgi:hypothetical protein
MCANGDPGEKRDRRAIMQSCVKSGLGFSRFGHSTSMATHLSVAGDIPYTGTKPSFDSDSAISTPVITGHPSRNGAAMGTSNLEQEADNRGGGRKGLNSFMELGVWIHQINPKRPLPRLAITWNSLKALPFHKSSRRNTITCDTGQTGRMTEQTTRLGAQWPQAVTIGKAGGAIVWLQ